MAEILAQNQGRKGLGSTRSPYGTGRCRPVKVPEGQQRAFICCHTTGHSLLPSSLCQLPPPLILPPPLPHGALCPTQQMQQPGATSEICIGDVAIFSQSLSLASWSWRSP